MLCYCSLFINSYSPSIDQTPVQMYKVVFLYNTFILSFNEEVRSVTNSQTLMDTLLIKHYTNRHKSMIKYMRGPLSYYSCYLSNSNI